MPWNAVVLIKPIETALEVQLTSHYSTDLTYSTVRVLCFDFILLLIMYLVDEYFQMLND